MAHICICDDEEGILRYLKKQMRDYQVDTFSGGMDLLKLLESSAGSGVDLLLQDVRMPDMDGLSAACLIRQRSQGGAVPLVVMITAYGREVLADAQQEDDAPFAEFLSKPVNKLELLTRVQSLLKARKLRQSGDNKDAYIRDLERMLEQTRGDGA